MQPAQIKLVAGQNAGPALHSVMSPWATAEQQRTYQQRAG
jgi:hypothetical protein